MKHRSIDPRLFVENRARLLEQLAERGKNAIAIVHSADIPPLSADGSMKFVQNSDLFYLTGVAQEESVLILHPGAEDPALREILFLRETSEEIAIWEGEKLTIEQAQAATGIETVRWTTAFRPALRRLARNVDTFFLNYNEHPRNGNLVKGVDDRFREECQMRYPNHRYERLAPMLHRQREVKHPIELELLKTACEITDRGFRRLLDFVKPGVLEYQIEAEMIHEYVRHGSRGFAYEPIVASGKNACVLHYLDNHAECQDGELLLMDCAAEYGHYNADLTRTIPVNGKFTERQRAVYEAVYRVFRAAIDELIVPGKPIKQVFNVEIGRLMEQELVGLGLLDADEVAEERADETKREEKRLYRKYFMHGTSHSLGLDVHDVTRAEPMFVEGMVVTVEPGIYIRDEAIGVRIENDIVVREGGNLDLMADIPVTVEEIEQLMAGS